MPEDILSPESITKNLGTRIIGRKVIYYPSVTSTNDLAKQEALKGAAEGTVVVGGEQVAGKGRIKRLWLTPRGNVALSVVLYPGKSSLPYLVMLASLAVAKSIEAVTDLKTQIKWPNDVLINGKKVCGILAESDVRGEKVAYAVVGIGINVNLRVADYPEIASIATSLSDELGRQVSSVQVTRRLLLELDKLYLLLPDGEEIFNAWQDSLITLGKKVRVTSGQETLEGVAESVYKDGSLVLRQADGKSVKIVAGDVTLREAK